MGVAPRPSAAGRGSHLCWAVDADTPFDGWAADFIAEGGRQGERLLWCAPESTLDQLTADDTVTRLDPSVAMRPGEPLDPVSMYRMIRQEHAAARAAGCSGLRILTDMDWLLGIGATPAELTTFELLLDEVAAELGATVACAYRSTTYPPATITEMMAVHPMRVGAAPFDPGLRVWHLGLDDWAVAGEVDLDNAELFGRLLGTAAAGRRVLRLSTAGLAFVAVAGINALLGLARSRPELRIVIAEASPALRRSWGLLDLHQELPRIEFAAARDPLRASAATPESV
nr:MEDS domain-containing protein [Natronosporangium hydrolyticum]